MNATETERETEIAGERRQCCLICGAYVQPDDPAAALYAHNTCSQLCACTAVIVGANERIAEALRALAPVYYVKTDADGRQTITLLEAYRRAGITETDIA